MRGVGQQQEHSQTPRAMLLGTGHVSCMSEIDFFLDPVDFHVVLTCNILPLNGPQLVIWTVPPKCAYLYMYFVLCTLLATMKLLEMGKEQMCPFERTLPH